MTGRFGAPPPVAVTDAVRQAWAALGVRGEPIREVLPLKETGGSAVFRLTRTGAPAIVAKRGSLQELSVEDVVYTNILPDLPLACPRYYGLGVDGEGLAWLFLEEVRGDKFRPDRKQHAVLAARWLFVLHTLGARATAARRLPACGPAHYLRLLRHAREIIEETMSGRALEPGQRLLLDRLAAQCERLELAWDQVETVSASVPEAVIHGDFKAKNIVVGANGGGPALFVLDWEMGGRGLPTVDLLGADVGAYTALVGPVWGVESDELEPAVRIGRVLQLVAWIAWASARLPFELIEPPLARLRHYSVWLDEALQDAFAG